MQRLLDFLRRSRYFLLLLLLEAAGFAMVSFQYDFHKSVMASLTGDAGFFLEKKAAAWRRHFSLESENARLAQENARLRGLVVSLGKTDSDTLEVPAASLPYEYTAASVVKNSFRNQKNYIVLDKGSADGIEKDQGVVTGGGVLGVIVQVGRHYSVCRSILHSDSYVSAKFLKNDYFGTVRWDGVDRQYVQLENIPRQANVQAGDTVVTDRRSTLFPPGLVVGTVAGAEVEPGSDFYDVRVRLNDDLANLHYVYVLRYKFDEELKQALDYD